MRYLIAALAIAATAIAGTASAGTLSVNPRGFKMISGGMADCGSGWSQKPGARLFVSAGPMELQARIPTSPGKLRPEPASGAYRLTVGPPAAVQVVDQAIQTVLEEQATPTPTPTPAATPTPTTTPMASPTVTPTPSATETPIPSATVTPTPTETTPPSLLVFDFEGEGADGWVFSTPVLPGFEAAVGLVNAARGSVDIWMDRYNAFGYFQSPIFEIACPGVPAKRPNTLGAPTCENTLFRSVFTVSTDVNDPKLVPPFRVRSSSYDHQQSDLLMMSSERSATFAPTGSGRDYVQYFTQPAGQSRFRLDFDAFNFNRLDAQNATLRLENATVMALDATQLANETTVARYIFLDGNTNGFTFRTVTPDFAAPYAEVTGRGLLIRGTNAVDKETTESLTATMFGYWGRQVPANRFVANKLYRLQWQVSTEASAANRSRVPTFRLRTNSSSLQLSTVTNIDSRNDSSRIPVDSASAVYTAYVETPDAIAGDYWMYSFDYLFAPVQDDDPSIGVVLEKLTITSFDIP